MKTKFAAFRAARGMSNARGGSVFFTEQGALFTF
jgi:hypothetical protein